MLARDRSRHDGLGTDPHSVTQCCPRDGRPTGPMSAIFSLFARYKLDNALYFACINRTVSHPYSRTDQCPLFSKADVRTMGFGRF